ncbi:hypothetical protein [Terrimicrobium sacchariphilum]|uniref:hypothetical protein n=1 Tax=Terrimicrobium sacchariphilum TaxID=690879 RepID=UPI001EDA6836|nr:hypothetical protein [Terrimicrobium sacchariphilum]
MKFATADHKGLTVQKEGCLADLEGMSGLLGRDGLANRQNGNKAGAEEGSISHSKDEVILDRIDIIPPNGKEKIPGGFTRPV